MRIACIHLPSLPLQAFLRRAPRWIGAPVAIVSGKSVVACSRAAWNLGVRPGMNALAAQELVPGLVTSVAEVGETLRALGDALLAVAARVELGDEIYAEVPPRTRGATFGARLIEVVEAQGLRARVGIADDRFTAWVGSTRSADASRTTITDHADRDPVVTVPRGGSAAFLAPLPLSLLAIPEEVQHVLGALGVRTLGEFAALPPPSPLVATAWDRDYQALARGDGANRLVPHVPAGPLVERVDLGGDVGIGAALERTARRIAGRLAGRGQAAAQVRVRTGATDSPIDVALAAPVADASDLADLIGPTLRDRLVPAFLEIEVPVTVAATAPAAIPEPVAAEASVPIAVASPPPVFRLEPPVLSMAPRDGHRRTHRGKHRTRADVAAQSRLFRA